MVKYVAGFYRTVEPFRDGTILQTLAALHDLQMGFFPASMWASKERQLTLAGPSEYRRAIIPAEYFAADETASIPFDCANRTLMTFTESNTPRLVPASLVIEFDGETITENGWRLNSFLLLFHAVIAAFRPDVADLHDEAHRDRAAYDQRMFEIDMRQVPLGLFWINYYGPRVAENIGRKRLERVRSSVASFEWLDDGGALVAIQEAPYDESDPAHRNHQIELERVIGLEEIHAQFPNRGI
jgi:hypothetical protein